MDCFYLISDWRSTIMMHKSTLLWALIQPFTLKFIYQWLTAAMTAVYSN